MLKKETAVFTVNLNKLFGNIPCLQPGFSDFTVFIKKIVKITPFFYVNPVQFILSFYFIVFIKKTVNT